MPRREGLLKPEFGEWYPTLTPGTWWPADRLAQAVLSQLSSGQPRWQPEGRVPSDEHFEFRGGDPRPAGERTRRTDPPTMNPD